MSTDRDPPDQLGVGEDEPWLVEGEVHRAAVIFGQRAQSVPERIARAHPRARLTGLPVAEPSPTGRARLVAEGPFDLIVDATGRPLRRADLWIRIFLHLADGGRYVALEPDRGRPKALDAGREPLSDRVARLADEEAAIDPSRAPLEQAIAAAIGEVRRNRTSLVVTRRGDSMVKLHEDEAAAVLRSRGNRVETSVTELPGGELVPRGDLRESPSERAGRMPTRFVVPELCRREYAEVTCAPGALVYSGRLLWPESFRHVERRDLRQRYLHHQGRRFATFGSARREPGHLPGHYYHLDSEFRGHFGHLLTEQVARLWGWRAAKTADPDLKLLIGSGSNGSELAPFEARLLAAAGVEESDVVVIDVPTRVQRLTGVTPMFSNPGYVHPDLVQVWHDLGARLAADAPDGDYPRRIFCARAVQDGMGSFGGERRVCHNGAEVERFFTKRGFQVIRPELHDLTQQARLFREAEVVAGYSGSAMFNLIFAGGPKHAVLVKSESYTARNEYLIAAAMGHRLDIAWCVADRPRGDRGPGSWRSKVFNSPFTFDFDREGRFLAKALRDL